jgi:hypothetical protein
MKKLTNFLSTTVLPILFMASTGLVLNVNAQSNGANKIQKEKYYAVMHKQLNIMSNIIKSAVVNENIKQYSRITGINSTYLTGQGVVITINSSDKNNRWGNGSFNFVMPTLPDLPPLPPIAQIDNNFNDLEVHETVSQAIESASQGYERAIEVMYTSRDEHRYLQD